jgi:mono/diheme cytochrome c family protein
MRPLTFHGNKIVVADPALAETLPEITENLRPWLYADSLARIELVTRRAWDGRFDAGEGVRDGEKVFNSSCRYCHAVRGAGGALGWDFVDPVPIYSAEWMKRFEANFSVDNPMPPSTLLMIHVRFRAGDPSRSMPALRGMSTAQVAALWSWLQAIAPARNQPR